MQDRGDVRSQRVFQAEDPQFIRRARRLDIDALDQPADFVHVTGAGLDDQLVAAVIGDHVHTGPQARPLGLSLADLSLAEPIDEKGIDRLLSVQRRNVFQREHFELGFRRNRLIQFDDQFLDQIDAVGASDQQQRVGLDQWPDGHDPLPRREDFVVDFRNQLGHHLAAHEAQAVDFDQGQRLLAQSFDIRNDPLQPFHVAAVPAQHDDVQSLDVLDLHRSQHAADFDVVRAGRFAGCGGLCCGRARRRAGRLGCRSRRLRRSRRFALWLEDHCHQLGFGLAVLLRSLLHHGDRLTDLLGIGMFDGNEPGLLRIVDLGLVQHADDLCPPLDGCRRAQKADRVAAAVDSDDGRRTLRGVGVDGGNFTISRDRAQQTSAPIPCQLILQLLPGDMTQGVRRSCRGRRGACRRGGDRQRLCGGCRAGCDGAIQGLDQMLDQAGRLLRTPDQHPVGGLVDQHLLPSPQIAEQLLQLRRDLAGLSVTQRVGPQSGRNRLLSWQKGQWTGQDGRHGKQQDQLPTERFLGRCHGHRARYLSFVFPLSVFPQRHAPGPGFGRLALRRLLAVPARAVSGSFDTSDRIGRTATASQGKLWANRGRSGRIRPFSRVRISL